MQFDIRTAALDDLAEQRIRLAVSLLPAYRLRGRLGAWDGTRCDLLIAAAGDAYGHRALSLAQRRARRSWRSARRSPIWAPSRSVRPVRPRSWPG
ncbi:MAG: hypothetical protein NVV68_05160 [Dokdonella sp.]|nr:hypothetical protein [Dokdonella sp.]